MPKYRVTFSRIEEGRVIVVDALTPAMARAIVRDQQCMKNKLRHASDPVTRRHAVTGKVTRLRA